MELLQQPEQARELALVHVAFDLAAPQAGFAMQSSSAMKPAAMQ
jgi:hypothetical protein